MSRRNQITLLVLAMLYLCTVAAFALEWFSVASIPNNFSGAWRTIDVVLFLCVTYILWLPIVMKITFIAIMSHIKEPWHEQAQPGLRVAMITTFVPGSESVELLHSTLPAMKRVDYPHDTWLLDEGDDPEVQAICRKYGVFHFSRKGKGHFNMPEGKFAKKTKGGNHNSWYEVVGNQYDIVAQMDTDFIPSRHFLTRTLGYFNDRNVAFVGTPQIYDNTAHSLIARGAAEQTYSFYGPLLRGMAGMDTVMLIGANHVIRVSALRSVDHYSAHITEDLLTGMKLHAKGWKSVYVPEALALGEGPVTWKAYFAQQKRWAYGCMHILYNHSYNLFKGMTLRRAVFYFMIQQHYFSGIATFIGLTCLALYFLFGLRAADTQLTDFFVTFGSVLIMSQVVTYWSQRFNIRPDKEKGVLWAGLYIGIAAWPIYLNAFFSLLSPSKLTYKVTPKGKAAPARQRMPLGLFAPHMLLAATSILCLGSSFFSGRGDIVMRFWALITSSLILVPVVPLIRQHVVRLKTAKSLQTLDPITESSQ